jgi:hypothetical protein
METHCDHPISGEKYLVDCFLQIFFSLQGNRTIIADLFRDDIPKPAHIFISNFARNHGFHISGK